MQWTPIKVQRSVPDKDVDIHSIPKTAITVIQNF